MSQFYLRLCKVNDGTKYDTTFWVYDMIALIEQNADFVFMIYVKN